MSDPEIENEQYINALNAECEKLLKCNTKLVRAQMVLERIRAIVEVMHTPGANSIAVRQQVPDLIRTTTKDE